MIHYHLPGLFEFYDLYRLILPLYRDHREYFYDWCDIGSIYGSPSDCLWGGGRVEQGDVSPAEVLDLLAQYRISGRLTLSNSLLREEHLADRRCNDLCALFARCNNVTNGAIVHSELLMEYLRANYPELYLVSSTTKVITGFDGFAEELERGNLAYVVPDFRLNKSLEKLASLPLELRARVEFLCNECCSVQCADRYDCYEEVSRKNLGLASNGHCCKWDLAGDGYRFSRAMENPMFISVDDIVSCYAPMGFTNFKLEGRGLGSALVLEILLYYMVKPEYQIHVREAIYLDNMLDLF